MDFERPDGVIVNVSESDRGFEFRLLNVNAPAGKSWNLCITSFPNTSQLIETSDLPSECSLHEHCAHVANRLAGSSSPGGHSPGTLTRRDCPLQVPTYVESSSLNQLLKITRESIQMRTGSEILEQKRTASLARILERRSAVAREALRRNRAEYQKSQCDRDMEDKEGELLYRSSQDKDQVRVISSDSASVALLRQSNIEQRLMKRAEDARHKIREMFSRAEKEGVDRDSMVLTWKQEARRRKLVQKSSIPDIAAIERKRDFNRHTRMGREGIRDKLYVEELKEQRRQIERKSKILDEKRRSLAHELFCRSVNYCDFLQSLQYAL